MIFEIKIIGLEKLIETLVNIASTLKSHYPTIKCSGAKLDKKQVTAYITHKSGETEIRCARYDTHKCRDPNLEKDADYQTLPFCTYIDEKYKV